MSTGMNWITISTASTDSPETAIHLRTVHTSAGLRPRTWFMDSLLRLADPGVLLVSPVPVSPRPCDREEKCAVLEGFDVVRHAVVKCEKAAGGQIERPSERPHPDAAANGMDGDSPLRLVSRNPGVRLECGQDDAKVVVLHEGLGVLAAGRLRFAVELLQLSREVEFQEGSGHRLRVRPPVRTLVVRRV